MSIFERPDSPPPRAPSPETQPAPLPSPHLRARLRPSSSQQSMASNQSHTLSPRTPPGLSPFPSQGKTRSISYQRSYDHIREQKVSPTSRDFASAATKHPRLRTRSTHSTTPPSPPRFLQVPVPSSPHGSEFAPHRRTLSNAQPYRSPPASPTLSSPPPPVPPIPAFVLDAMAEKKAGSPPKPLPVMPIQLPDLDKIPPLSEGKILPRKTSLASIDENGRSKGMTCLKFFTLRNTKRRPQTANT